MSRRSHNKRISGILSRKKHTKQTAGKIREALQGTGLEQVFNKWLLNALETNGTLILLMRLFSGFRCELALLDWDLEKIW